jgi:hypothetical protein
MYQGRSPGIAETTGALPEETLNLYRDMLQVANLSTTRRLPGHACFHLGMRIRITASVLPPWAVQDATGTSDTLISIHWTSKCYTATCHHLLSTSFSIRPLFMYSSMAWSRSFFPSTVLQREMPNFHPIQRTDTSEATE